MQFCAMRHCLRALIYTAMAIAGKDTSTHGVFDFEYSAFTFRGSCVASLITPMHVMPFSFHIRGSTADVVVRCSGTDSGPLFLRHERTFQCEDRRAFVQGETFFKPLLQYC